MRIFYFVKHDHDETEVYSIKEDSNSLHWSTKRNEPAFVICTDEWCDIYETYGDAKRAALKYLYDKAELYRKAGNDLRKNITKKNIIDWDEVGRQWK